MDIKAEIIEVIDSDDDEDFQRRPCYQTYCTHSHAHMDEDQFRTCLECAMEAAQEASDEESVPETAAQDASYEESVPKAAQEASSQATAPYWVLGPDGMLVLRRPRGTRGRKWRRQLKRKLVNMKIKKIEQNIISHKTKNIMPCHSGASSQETLLGPRLCAIGATKITTIAKIAQTKIIGARIRDTVQGPCAIGAFPETVQVPCAIGTGCNRGCVISGQWPCAIGARCSRDCALVRKFLPTQEASGAGGFEPRDVGAEDAAHAPEPKTQTQHTPRKLPTPIFNLAGFQKRCDNLMEALTAWNRADAQNKEVEEVVEAAAKKLAALETLKAMKKEAL